MVSKLPKLVHFSQICADLSKKSKFIKAVYLYPLERSIHALSEIQYVLWGFEYQFTRYLRSKYQKVAFSAKI